MPRMRTSQRGVVAVLWCAGGLLLLSWWIGSRALQLVAVTLLLLANVTLLVELRAARRRDGVARPRG